MMPACTSCVSSRSSRYGRSFTSSKNSTQPGGGSNANGVPSEAASWVMVPPTSTPEASPSRQISRPGGTSAPIGSVTDTARTNESRS